MASEKSNPFDAPSAVKQETSEAGSDSQTWRLGVLILHGVVIAVLMGLISYMSQSFDLKLPFLDRPILEVVACFVAAFWLYIAAIVIGRKLPDSFGLGTTIVGFAILFRLLMFISTPIQEVDIYRYIWDGIVVSEGVSPFRYSPDQVRMTPPNYTHSDPELRKLVSRYRQGHGAADALNLVHFGQVPTVYPPVSQAVFGVAALTTPPDASLLTRLRIMKAWLILFDLGTVVVLILLLKSLGMPMVYSIAYAWCPLVLKEIGNSGHLDSIAIFLTTLAVYLFVRFVMIPTSWNQYDSQRDELGEEFQQGYATSESLVPPFWSISTLGLLLPVVFLALAIGAKIYAIVLAPLFVFVAVRRLGWQSAILPAVVFIAITAIVSFPMLPGEAPPTAQVAQQPNNAPDTGLAIFLKYWEMNDFIFMNTVENLKPPSLQTRKDVWFSVLPEEPRESLSSFVIDKFGADPNIAPFLTARFLLTLVFIVVALLIAFWAAVQNHSAAFCRAAFLTLAWFWLLAPTQNPWYWLWALPLLPFAKNRTWYLMSGFLFIYYIRFWFEYHFTGVTVADSFPSWLSFLEPYCPSQISKYQGVDFFDFVVTWFEYLPWYVMLGLETIWGLSVSSSSAEQ